MIAILPSFLVPGRKVRLMPTARMSCSNAANIDLDAKLILRLAKFRQGARAPKMYIQCTSPGNRQTSCKVWLTSAERRWCSNETKTRNPLKLAGGPQTTGPISAASAPKFTILWAHVAEILLLNKFFRLSIRALVTKIQPGKVVRWCLDGDFLRPVFSASCVQHVSDLRRKFALRLHHVWK